MNFKKHKVLELYVFGSILTDKFNKEFEFLGLIQFIGFRAR